MKRGSNAQECAGTTGVARLSDGIPVEAGDTARADQPAGVPSRRRNIARPKGKGQRAQQAGADTSP